MDNPEAYLARLQPIYIFKGLDDQAILEVAQKLELERCPAGQVIFTEGGEGQDFYIIDQGQVNVRRHGNSRETRLVATLVAGDFFGEGALLYARRRAATLEAANDVQLLRLGKEDFDALLLRFPQIRPNLLLTHESRELYYQRRFNWLAPDEVVYLIARRHKLLLYQSLILPVAVGVAVAGGAIWLAAERNAMGLAWAGVLLEVPVALWMVWNSIDWSNDFYIVTNKRLAYIEKIIGLYDSRQEAPLGSIMSVNIQTHDALQRALGFGDVVVRTFSGPILLRSVANPAALAAAIEEYWYRIRTRDREAQMEQMQRSLRQRLAGGRITAPPAARPGVTVVAAAARPRPSAPPLSDMFSFRVRFERGGNVVYRKHWYMLIRRLWRPSLGVLALLTLLTLGAGGFMPASISRSALVWVAGLACLPLILWWLYEYVDWRNDIYMVTADQIFDVSKKPLGAETRKSAPLANVLSLKYERPGLLGLLLNYGTVVALVAGTEFRFEGVFDPVSVQNDVYRHLEANNAHRAATDSLKRREEVADFLSVYQQVQGELEHGEPTAPHRSPVGGASPMDEGLAR